MEKDFIERLRSANDGEKLDIIDKYFDQILKLNDVKNTTSTIKICLEQCAGLNIECKNDPRLLLFFIKISKFFKNKAEFFKKLYEQSFFHHNPNFYNAWILGLNAQYDQIEIEKIKNLQNQNCIPHEKISEPIYQPLISKPSAKKESLLPLYNRFINFQPEVSLEEYLSFLWLLKYSNKTECLENIQDSQDFWEIYNDVYKQYINDSARNNMIESCACDSLAHSVGKLSEEFDDTVNKTLQKVKPLPPDSTPTVNTKEARGFIDVLCQKPAFDSSDDEDEDFFTKVMYQRKAVSPHILHKSVNILDVWKSPATVKSDTIKEIGDKIQNIASSTTNDDKTNTYATSGYGTMTSGCISIDKPLYPSGPGLCRPFIETPFAKFKQKLNEKSNNIPKFVNPTPETINMYRPVNAIDLQNDDTTIINFQNPNLKMYTSTPSLFKSNN